MSNLSIWQAVERTDPAYTKNFSRGGGFSGTSINAIWLARRATETFGPMGIGWGVDIVAEDFLPGHVLNEAGEKSVIHRVQVKLWYVLEGQRGEVTHFGQTTFIGANKHGLFTDEEAPKKSLTDATTKALSMLGFGGDIFMGLYDDQQYREEVTQQSLLEKADDKDQELARQREEYIAWRKDHLELVRTARSRSELKILHSMVARKMTRHNDTPGQRILETMRDEAMARLEGAENEHAA